MAALLFRGATIQNLNVLPALEQIDYNDRFEIYSDPVLIDGIYYLYDNDDGLADYTIGNPDFNFHQFRSNLVAKWEYRLGSFIYLVWSSERTGRTGSSNASIGESFRELSRYLSK